MNVVMKNSLTDRASQKQVILSEMTDWRCLKENAFAVYITSNLVGMQG